MPEDPKIFGIGFQRTGTSSLYEAFRLLGYRANHGVFINSTKRSSIWIEPPLTSEEIVRRVMPRTEEARAFSDNPWPLLFRELDAAFPGSKFILTVRPPERWIASMVRYFGSEPREIMRFIYGVPCPAGHEARCVDVYLAHNEAVRRHFENRPDDLLEIDLADGDPWPRLCAFLGRSVPDKSFPHRNPAAEAETKKSSLRMRIRRFLEARRALPEKAALRLRYAIGHTESPSAARLWRKLLRPGAQTSLAGNLAAAYFCAVDPQTPIRVKAALMAALGYFVMPIDIVPDFFAGIGYLDDGLVLALAIWLCTRFIGKRHRAQAQAVLGLRPASASSV